MSRSDGDMKQKVFSVCCLGYNHAKFIEANINAIFSSKYEAVEIIAVDDGSSDDSGKILNALKEKSKFPMKVILQENTGKLGLNLNRAIQAAQGEYITFVALDDVLNMQQIDKTLAAMNADSKLAFVAATNFDIIDAFGNVTENRKLPIYEKTTATVDEMLDLEFCRFESFWLQGTVFRREIIDAVHGFDEDMLGDDIVLRTKILRYLKGRDDYSFKLIDAPLFCYRLHGSNVSGNTLRQIKSVTEYLDRYWPDRASPGIYKEWLSYGIGVYDDETVKSLFIPNKRLAASLNDEGVMLRLMDKVWRPLQNFHKEHARSKFYFDLGSGFGEGNSAEAHYISGTSAKVSFELPNKDVKALRFDPSEDSGILKIHCIKIKKNDGSKVEVDLKNIRSNAIDRIGEAYVFLTEDPYISFVANDCANAFAVEIEFEWGCDAEAILRLCRNSEPNLTDTQNERDVVSRELESARREINDMLNSWSWKLSKPVRFVGRGARKVLPKKVKSALKILLKGGLKELCVAIKKRLSKKYGMAPAVAAWKKRKGFCLSPLAFGMTNAVFKAQRKIKFDRKIKFSVLVPLCNTPKEFLQEMIGSVLFQTYENWELCLADGSDDAHKYVGEICEGIAKKDSRIKYRKLEKNAGISENTNACVSMATGDYISLFDHDDLLHPAALFETMKAICEKDADFVYTDEATFESPDLHKIIHTNFKPDYAPDYFLGLNYVCHFSSFKKGLLEKTGGFCSECDGAQDYDLFLKLFEQTDRIVHIPKCLYYWRASPTSTAFRPDAKNYTSVAGQKALQKHFERCGIDAKVEIGRIPNLFRISYPIKGSPLVSILIPNCDHAQTLKKCLDSIKKLTTYKNYEIVIVENNSKSQETFDYYESLKGDKRIKVVEWKGEFNYSAINNYGFGYVNGDYVVLLNNDIEVIAPRWIEEMLMFAQRDDVGAVGAMLFYPNDMIQHAGVVLGIGGVAGHSHKFFLRGSYGYVSRLVSVQNYSCVTAACLMVSSKIYKEVGGLDESFEVAFNDVDFCMKIRKSGYLNVWTPFAKLYHYESESRGYEDTPEKIKRFNGEIARFQQKWKKELSEGDPFYNPNLSHTTENFSVNEGAVFSGSYIALVDRLPDLAV